MTEDDVRWQRRKQRCIYKNIIKLKECAFIGCSADGVRGGQEEVAGPVGDRRLQEGQSFYS